MDRVYLSLERTDLKPSIRMKARRNSCRVDVPPSQQRRSLPSQSDGWYGGKSELLVEDGVEDRVDARVGVSEPEEEGVELARHVAVRTAAVHDVHHEEPQPESAEERG